jgi:Ca2+-binding RTX toxin-like protein
MLADAGNDKLYGRDGEDYLEGDTGRDSLVGGSSPDTLDAATSDNPLGLADIIKAGDGHDIIEGENQKSDRIACGAGEDVALVDSFDRVSRDCELIG